jgi:hypothetical protein
MLRITIFKVILTTLSTIHAVTCTNSNFYGTILASTNFVGSSQIDNSPKTSFAAPKYDSINASNWDEWYFDGISKDGNTGLSILFARDATLSRWGLPNLRVSLDCVWPNGTKFTTMMFANTSSVLEHEGIIIGEWVGSDWTATFKTDTDNSKVTVIFASPQIQGSYELISTTKAHYANNYTFPDDRGSVVFAPMIHWNEAVPAGNLSANFLIEGKELQISGYGGWDHNWAPWAYDYFAAQWRWMRAILGPYTMIFWVHTSAIDNNTYTSAFLFENEQVLFESIDNERIDLSLRYDGDVHGQFRDLSTGFDVQFKLDGNVTWWFQIDHQKVVFESDALSANNEYSRFTNGAKGGIIGGDTFEGVAVNEQGFIIEQWEIPFLE